MKSLPALSKVEGKEREREKKGTIVAEKDRGERYLILFFHPILSFSDVFPFPDDTKRQVILFQLPFIPISVIYTE